MSVAEDRGLQVARLLTIGVWTVVFMLLPLVLLQLPLLVNRLRPPYEIPEAVVLTPQVRVGDKLAIRYHVIRKRVCRVDVGWFMRDAKEVVVLRLREPGGAQPVGDWPNIVNELTVPDGSKPGVYTLSTDVLNECMEGTHSVSAPTVHFEVID